MVFPNIHHTLAIQKSYVFDNPFMKTFTNKKHPNVASRKRKKKKEKRKKKTSQAYNTQGLEKGTKVQNHENTFCKQANQQNTFVNQRWT